MHTYTLARKKGGGFSIVELLIVITILGILLIVTTSNFSSSSIQARDMERKDDVSNLARYLEDWYRGTGQGKYPSTVEFSGSDAWALENLTGIDPAILRAPGTDGYSVIPASNTSNSIAGIAPQPTQDQYVYQPIRSDGGLCSSLSQGCVRYNLFYRLEDSGLIIKKVSFFQ